MATPHATLLKFGYPHTTLAELDHWAILLRPQQVTLGALVLCHLGGAPSLSAMPGAAFSEMHAAVVAIENGLRRFRTFDKVNYLALMMFDPHVHFHVLPRYSAAQHFAGWTFQDLGWPGPPDLKQANTCPAEVMENLRLALVDAFGKDR